MRDELPQPGGPLADVRVLDLGTMFAGPFAASLLGDFGADVIKVELPGAGDAIRSIAPAVKGVPAQWTTMARNKRCITLDLRKEKGKEILLRLVALSDVVVENFRPGTLEGWGLGFDALRQANPGVILVRISGFGQTGPYSHRTGFATVGAAFSGLTYQQGYPDRPPVNPPPALVDYMAGTFGAMAALTALHHVRTQGGEGQVVDVSLFEAAFRTMEPMVVDYDFVGRVRERMGSMAQGSMPTGTFRCRDGRWMVLAAATDRTFGRLAEVMGRADLLRDPRFDVNAHRMAHREEITAIVQEWLSQHDMDEAMGLLDAAGVPASPINSVADIFRDPHYRSRDDLIEVPHPVLGKVTMPGIVPKLSGTPGAVRFPGPVSLGEHNREIYQDLLGLSPEQLDALAAEDVI